MAHNEPPHEDLLCLQIQLFGSLVLKELTNNFMRAISQETLGRLHNEVFCFLVCLLHSPSIGAGMGTTQMLTFCLTLLHLEQPKLHRVLAVLSAVGLNFCCMNNKHEYSQAVLCVNQSFSKYGDSFSFLLIKNNFF